MEGFYPFSFILTVMLTLDSEFLPAQAPPTAAGVCPFLAPMPFWDPALPLGPHFPLFTTGKSHR